MTKIKGDLSTIRDLTLGNPLAKAQGGTGATTFPFFDSVTADAGGQSLTDTFADVTNSSKSVSFPDGVQYIVFNSIVRGSLSGNETMMLLQVLIDGNVSDLGREHIVDGFGSDHKGSRIIDVSAHAGSMVTVKLQARRIFFTVTVDSVEWQLLSF